MVMHVYLLCPLPAHHGLMQHVPFRAPDGTCLLVASADCKVRLYNLPSELYAGPVSTQLPEMVRLV